MEEKFVSTLPPLISDTLVTGMGAGAGEQEEKVEEEQEPAEVLPPACFNLEEHKLKVCSIHLRA